MVTGSPLTRTKTTAYVDWIGTANNNNWVAGSSYSTPDVKTIIEEVRSLSNWNGVVTFLARDNGSTPNTNRRRYVRHLNYPGFLSAATLTINFSEQTGIKKIFKSKIFNSFLKGVN